MSAAGHEIWKAVEAKPTWPPPGTEWPRESARRLIHATCRVVDQRLANGGDKRLVGENCANLLLGNVHRGCQFTALEKAKVSWGGCCLNSSGA